MRLICAKWALVITLLSPIIGFTSESPREKLFLLLAGDWIARSIYTVAQLEVADYIQDEGTSIEELSSLTETDTQSLYRLLSMLASFDVFHESAPRVFSHTPTSRLLIQANPETLHPLTLFFSEDMHKAWGNLSESIKTGKPAFDLVFQEPIFDHFKNNPRKAVLFQKAMQVKSKAVIDSLLTSYDFTPFHSVYDVGGGYGQLINALVARYPDIQGHLFELPEVIEMLKTRSVKTDLIAGDFFLSLPRGGDAYILKSVLHDWDDERCELILKNCACAMTCESKLLIVEIVLLPDTLSPYAHCMDMHMLAITGGKERSLKEFEVLLAKAGLVLDQIHQTETEFSILEVKKQ